MNKITRFEFHHRRFRTVEKDRQAWFVAKDVCDILEIKNVSDAVARLDEDERGIVTNDTPSGAQEMLIVSESGLYALIWSSRKPEAKTFRRWVTHEVLPQIRKTGSYVSEPSKPIGILPLASHTDQIVQKTMSKVVNGFNIRLGGRELAVQYNVANSVAHTGKTPSALKKEGKKAGLKSKDYSSGKAVVRVFQPPAACCMSLADNLREQNIESEKVFEVTQKALPVFEGILALGLTPPEFNQK